MSAMPDTGARYRAMRADDLAAVIAIENVVYEFPWSQGNFADSILAGYCCRVLEQQGMLVGYGVLTVAAGESHLLNLSIAAQWQRRGLGRTLLGCFVEEARRLGARILLLEVRPSNPAARALYESSGFELIAMRRAYYPAAQGKEDAIVMSLSL
jgi:ribosomal-protein-alanine N-acetyltransferase